jgi:hypothetical protein
MDVSENGNEFCEEEGILFLPNNYQQEAYIEIGSSRPALTSQYFENYPWEHSKFAMKSIRNMFSP